MASKWRALAADSSASHGVFQPVHVTQCVGENAASVAQPGVPDALQLLDKNGWLVNGSSSAALSKACKKAIEGWPGRVECLELEDNQSDAAVVWKLLLVAQHCPHLWHLALGDTYSVYPRPGNISDGIQAVAQRCPEMRHLVLGPNPVSTAAMQAVARGCPDLESLILYDCDVTDAAIQAVAEGCPNLRELDVTGCTALTNSAIISVARGCPQMRELSMCSDVAYTEVRFFDTFNITITDVAIQEIAQQCPHLEGLSVCGPSRHTDAGIQAVAQGCVRLVGLGVESELNPNQIPKGQKAAAMRRKTMQNVWFWIWIWV